MGSKSHHKRRERTYARNRALSVSRRGRVLTYENDGTYLLKLVVVLLLGTMWLKLQNPLSWHGVPFGAFPLGTIVGLVAVKLFENDQLNRKILYAVLIIVTVICYFLPAGIVI